MKQLLLFIALVAGLLWTSNSDYQAQVEYQQGLNTLNGGTP